MMTAPATTLIRQARQAAFRHLMISDNLLIQVHQGTKNVSVNGLDYQIPSNGIGLIPARYRATIENIPEPERDYLATIICIPTALKLPSHPTDEYAEPKGRLSCPSDPALTSAFDRAVAAIKNSEQLPPSIIEHRIQEVILWLQEKQIYVPIPTPERLADRIRALFQSDLCANWKSGTIANRLGMSEATLRRKLAAESTSFSEELVDVRLSHALYLLQTSQWSIGRIAAESGYQSQSRFSDRFHKRFGVTPSMIRTTAQTLSASA
ncbi:AraC family transcriptional regulator [Oleiphilus messinensis]|uniref:AraC family transcriptional regulator n=1 Tax=Oleiphilus messinensis TaxID=141451 RepID=A0A1Y0I5J4_9GAMM|nr:helix-turn-helix transcriptional regulator [Oleiphilus messinensis]ARU54673.1 AraC family transcriptional regulator [Oleiphilus messinensis]